MNSRFGKISFGTGLRAGLVFLVLIISLMICSPVCAENLFASSHMGRSMVRDKTAKRAVVISVSLEESIVALDAWDNIISLPHTSFDNALIRGLNLPKKEATTFSNAENFNIESLFRMNPDLVLTWVGNDSLITRLQSFSIPMVTVHPRTMEEITIMLRTIGMALGRKERADELAGVIQRIFADLEYEVPERPVRVLWLGGTPTLVYGKKWLFHDLIQRAGGKDVTGDLSFIPWVAELSMEQIVALDPEVIVIGGWASYEPGDLLADPRWAGIRAVKTRRIHKTPKGRANYSPYAALMALMTAHWCYPDRFPVDFLRKKLDIYHREFYGVGFEEIHPDFFKHVSDWGSS